MMSTPSAHANQATPVPARLEEIETVHTRLCRLVGQAVADYEMIEKGDKVMVCLSGGKDSHGLLDILLSLHSRAPIQFEIIAVNLDQKQPGFPAHILPDYLSGRGIPFHIETQDTYSIVKHLIPEGETMCSLCARLRRGHLYRLATQLGATKIALGHHRDDILETLLLNLFFNGKIRTMPPKLRSQDHRHIVIRPLAYVKEADLARYAELKDFPYHPLRSPRLAGQHVAAISNVAPSLLLDRRLFDFVALQPLVNPVPAVADRSRSRPVAGVSGRHSAP